MATRKETYVLMHILQGGVKRYGWIFPRGGWKIFLDLSPSVPAIPGCIFLASGQNNLLAVSLAVSIWMGAKVQLETLKIFGPDFGQPRIRPAVGTTGRLAYQPAMVAVPFNFKRGGGD